MLQLSKGRGYTLGACVQEQQAREQAMAARMQEEAEANMTEMDKARDMLKMKTVKIQQASAEVGRFLFSASTSLSYPARTVSGHAVHPTQERLLCSWRLTQLLLILSALQAFKHQAIVSDSLVLGWTVLQDPIQEEMRIKMRKAKRQMKGVKLQYTDDDRVTFDDVAGIGESKVSPCSLSPASPPPIAQHASQSATGWHTNYILRVCHASEAACSLFACGSDWNRGGVSRANHQTVRCNLT